MINIFLSQFAVYWKNKILPFFFNFFLFFQWVLWKVAIPILWRSQRQFPRYSIMFYKSTYADQKFWVPPWQRNSNVLILHFIRSIVRSVFRLHFWLYRFPSINQNVYSFNISFRSFHRFTLNLEYTSRLDTTFFTRSPIEKSQITVPNFHLIIFSQLSHLPRVPRIPTHNR